MKSLVLYTLHNTRRESIGDVVIDTIYKSQDCVLTHVTDIMKKYMSRFSHLQRKIMVTLCYLGLSSRCKTERQSRLLEDSHENSSYKDILPRSLRKSIMPQQVRSHVYLGIARESMTHHIDATI